MTEKKPLKDWVLEDLASDTTTQLDGLRDEVAGLLTLTRQGEVVPKVDSNKLDSKGRILLEAIGRAYAEVGGLIENAAVSAPRLEPVTGAPSGTLGWALSELRKERLLVSDGHGKYRILPGRLADAISRVKTSLGER